MPKTDLEPVQQTPVFLLRVEGVVYLGDSAIISGWEPGVDGEEGRIRHTALVPLDFAIRVADKIAVGKNVEIQLHRRRCIS